MTRAAISADLDEGVDDVARERVSLHLGGCAACRGWQELAHVVTRRTRLGVAIPPASLAASLAAAVRQDARRRRLRRYWLAVARCVVGAGLIQLLATVPLLMIARSTSGAGIAHVIAVVELAIGAGFFLGAVVVLWRERDQRVLELAAPASDAAAADPGDVSDVA